VINLNASVGFNSEPNVAMRNGDFSALAPIYNPATTTSAVGTDGKTYLNRTQFAGNKLPTLDPVAVKLQAYLPLPNVAGTTNATTLQRRARARGIRLSSGCYSRRRISSRALISAATRAPVSLNSIQEPPPRTRSITLIPRMW